MTKKEEYKLIIDFMEYSKKNKPLNIDYQLMIVDLWPVYVKVLQLTLQKYRSEWRKFLFTIQGSEASVETRNYHMEKIWGIRANKGTLEKSLYTCIVECIKYHNRSKVFDISE